MLPRGSGYTRRLVIHLQQFSTTGLTYDPRPRFYTPPPNPKSLVEFQVFCQPMEEDVRQSNVRFAHLIRAIGCNKCCH